MRAPREDGLLLRIVVGKVVLGHADGQALVEVAPELVGQGVAAVLKVSRDVDLVEVARGQKCGAARKASERTCSSGCLASSVVSIAAWRECGM